MQSVSGFLGPTHGATKSATSRDLAAKWLPRAYGGVGLATSMRLLAAATIVVIGFLTLMVTAVAPVAAAKPSCNDGVDNDGDGAIDYPADAGCSGNGDDDETNPA